MTKSISREIGAALKRLIRRSSWELFRALVNANFKVYDHNSFLGVFWTFLSPAAFFIVTYFIFRRQFSAGSTNYPIYLLSGIIAVNFFVTATSNMIKVLTRNREFILNTTVPRDIFMAASFFTHVYKFTVEIVFCAMLAFVFKLLWWGSLIPLIVLWITYSLFVIGVGMMISLIYCYIRDAEYLWSLLSRLLFFATPVVYHLEDLSPLLRSAIYFLNPVVPFVEGFHQTLTLGAPNLAIFAHSVILGSVTFAAGYTLFLHFEKQAMETA